MGLELAGPGLYRILRGEEEGQLFQKYHNQLVSPGGAADLMGCSRQTIWKWAKEEKIYYFQVVKKDHSVNASTIWIPVESLITADLSPRYLHRQKFLADKYKDSLNVDLSKFFRT